MGVAYQCDLCRNLQAGTPPQTLTAKPAAAPQATTYQLCDACTASYMDWRTDRSPQNLDAADG